jgi:hypothetical protein
MDDMLAAAQNIAVGQSGRCSARPDTLSALNMA